MALRYKSSPRVAQVRTLLVTMFEASLSGQVFLARLGSYEERPVQA